MKTLISILTPTYNRADTYLSETIKRIQNQCERGFEHEHIIVDNASSDNTEEVVREFMKEDKRIKYIRNDKNLWASGALNVAFEHSKGDLIVPFDDDDIMPELSLQVRFEAMENKAIKWTSGQAIYVDHNGKLFSPEDGYREYISHALPFLDENYELKDAKKFFLSFFRKSMIRGGTVTIRRKCIEEVGGWDPSFTTNQDTDMWFKLAHRQYHYKLLNHYLFFYRMHESQSHRQINKEEWIEVSNKLRSRYGINDQVLTENGL